MPENHKIEESQLADGHLRPGQGGDPQVQVNPSVQSTGSRAAALLSAKPEVQDPDARDRWSGIDRK